MSDEKRVRRTPEQIAADLDVQIEKLKDSILELENKKAASATEFDNKIAAVKEKIAKLEAKKKDVLTPKKRKPRKSKADQIKLLVRQAQKSGMKLDEIGIDLEVDVDKVKVHGMKGELKGTAIKTKPYPGFATDIQQPLTTLLTQANGQSIITETIYPERFKHCGELKKMGAHIDVMVPSCFINGPVRLSGTEVVATDLRCGAALVVAGLIADGITEIHDIYHIDRGYENLDGKLSELGAHIWRETIE